MPTITRFEEIEAWQSARQLTQRIYALSSQGTFARDFGLRDQMRRASVSVMSNIAEGFESRTFDIAPFAVDRFERGDLVKDGATI